MQQLTLEDAITFSVLHRLPDWEWLNPEWQQKQEKAMAEAIATMPNPFEGDAGLNRLPIEPLTAKDWEEIEADMAAEAAGVDIEAKWDAEAAAMTAELKAQALREIAERN